MILKESHLKIWLCSISSILFQFSNTLSQKLFSEQVRHLDTSAMWQQGSIPVVPKTQFEQKLRYVRLTWDPRIIPRV